MTYATCKARYELYNSKGMAEKAAFWKERMERKAAKLNPQPAERAIEMPKAEEKPNAKKPKRY